MPRLTPRQALLTACLVSGLITAACASVAPLPYVDQAALAQAASETPSASVEREAE